jgi:hypothetical protein
MASAKFVVPDGRRHKRGVGPCTSPHFMKTKSDRLLLLGACFILVMMAFSWLVVMFQQQAEIASRVPRIDLVVIRESIATGRNQWGKQQLASFKIEFEFYESAGHTVKTTHRFVTINQPQSHWKYL